MADNTIMNKGMTLLSGKLGIVNSEIFIFNADSITDYSQWRQNQPWFNKTLSEINKSAVDFEKAHPELIPKNARII